MAKALAKCNKIWVGGYDWTGKHTQISLTYAAAVKESTTFCEDPATFVGGLKSWKVAGSGYQEAIAETDARPDKEIEDGLLGANNTEVSLVTGSTVGSVGYFGYATQVGYTTTADLGELWAFTMNAQGSGSIYRGWLLGEQAITTAAAAGGTAFQAGTASGKTIRASAHCWLEDCSTIDLKVQSSPNGTDTWTDRLTFTQLAAIGAEIKSADIGAVDDTYWRVYWDVSGGNGDASFGVVFSIDDIGE